MKLKFDYYLLDDYNGAEHQEWCDDLVEAGSEIPLTDLYAWFENQPFYELTVHVEYDTETRAFEIVGCE